MTLSAPRESVGDANRPPALSEAFLRAMRSHPETMVRLILELHRAVHDDASLLDLFHRAVNVARECIPGVQWCSITVQFGKAPFTAAHTEGWALEIDDQQYALGDGPCLRSMRTEQVVLMDQDELVGTWPSLADAVWTVGVRSVLSAPLPGPDGAAGAINLYSSAAAAFTTDSLDVTTVLGEYVTRGMADFAAVRSATEQAAQLKQAMVSRAPIEQAKGILMAVHQISAEEAFELLRSQSQNGNIKLHDVAVAFVAAQSAHSIVDMQSASSGAGDFQSAFDHAPDGMCLATPQGILLTVNPALAAMLHRDNAELVGMNYLELIDPDDVPAARSALTELLEQPELTRSVHLRWLRPDGSTVPVRASAAKVLGVDGRPSHLVAHLQVVG